MLDSIYYIGIVNRALCYNNVISCGFLGINSCTDNPVWAKKHCAAFCNICGELNVKTYFFQ